MCISRLSLIASVLLAGPWLAQGQPVQNPINGHNYEVVIPPALLDWYMARDAAAARSFGGAAGHLATITTQQEQNFIRVHFGDGAGLDLHGIWLGGLQDHNAPDYSEPAGGWFVFATTI